MKNPSNHQKSYDLQKWHMDQTAERRSEPFALVDGSASFWRHRRMYDTLSPLTVDKDARWLTVGDGRMGSDSARLKLLFGLKNVLPSDISEKVLAEGKRQGLIDDYSVEIAEMLSFPDSEFDYVLCKEAFHHCPRAWVAFYEMCRVARKAVVLIEPVHNFHFVSPRTRKLKMKDRLVALVRGRLRVPLPKYVFDEPEYESSGNYVYRLSRQELEQVVRGLSLPGYAWKGLADFTKDGLGDIEADDSVEEFRVFKEEVERVQRIHDRMPDRQPVAVATAIVFKEAPTDELKELLTAIGYRLFLDCENPILQDENPALEVSE